VPRLLETAAWGAYFVCATWRPFSPFPRFQVPQSPGKMSQDNRRTGSGTKNTGPTGDREKRSREFCVILTDFLLCWQCKQSKSDRHPLSTQHFGLPLSFALCKVDAFVWFVSHSWPTPLGSSFFAHSNSIAISISISVQILTKVLYRSTRLELLSFELCKTQDGQGKKHKTNRRTELSNEIQCSAQVALVSGSP